VLRVGLEDAAAEDMAEQLVPGLIERARRCGWSPGGCFFLRQWNILYVLVRAPDARIITIDRLAI